MVVGGPAEGEVMRRTDLAAATGAAALMRGQTTGDAIGAALGMLTSCKSEMSLCLWDEGGAQADVWTT